MSRDPLPHGDSSSFEQAQTRSSVLTQDLIPTPSPDPFLCKIPTDMWRFLPFVRDSNVFKRERLESNF